MPGCPLALRMGDNNLAAYETARLKAVEAAQIGGRHHLRRRHLRGLGTGIHERALRRV